MSFYGQIIKQIHGALQALTVGTNTTQTSTVAIEGDAHINVGFEKSNSDDSKDIIKLSHKEPLTEKQNMQILTSISNNDDSSINLIIKSATINKAGHINGINSVESNINIPKKLNVVDNDDNGNIEFYYGIRATEEDNTNEI